MKNPMTDARLYVTPDGVVMRACPDMGEHQQMVTSWIKDSKIEGEWFDDVFFFSNKDDYNTLKFFK